MLVKCPKCNGELKVNIDCIICKARQIEFDFVDLKDTSDMPQYVVKMPSYDYDYCFVSDVQVYCTFCDYTETMHIGESYKDEDECIKEVVNMLHKKFLRTNTIK